MFLQINMVKYNADREITNIYENLQIVGTHFFTDLLPFVNIFGLLQISIGLLVFRFVVNKYKRITIHALLTICNIQSVIWWAITKVILNCLISSITLKWGNLWILVHFQQNFRFCSAELEFRVTRFNSLLATENESPSHRFYYTLSCAKCQTISPCFVML